MHAKSSQTDFLYINLEKQKSRQTKFHIFFLEIICSPISLASGPAVEDEVAEFQASVHDS